MNIINNRKIIIVILLLISSFIIYHNLTNQIYYKSELSGMKLPDITLPIINSNGEEFNFQNITDPMFLIVFFSLWCKPCLMQHNFLNQIADEIDIPIYGVVLENQPAKVQKLLSDHGNPYKMVIYDSNSTLARAMKINGFPSIILVNRNKEVITSSRGSLSRKRFNLIFLPYISKK